MKVKSLLFIAFLLCSQLQAQEYFPTNTGVKTQNTNLTVFKNAKIHVDPTTIIENGMFIVKDGKIAAIGKSVEIPKNSVVIDLAGKEVYPSFIDVFSSFGIEKPKGGGGNPYSGNPQYDADREGYYWNDHIRPETKALSAFKFDEKQAEKLQQAGFGVVNTHMPDGIVRGTGMLVALNSAGTQGDRIISDRSAQYLSFDKSAESKQIYPASKMGAMALLRQVYHDAKWYQNGGAKNKDLALKAFNENTGLTQIFDAGSLLDVLRADKVGDQFDVQYVILGDGFEFEKIEAIKATNATLIVPLNFPDAYDLEDPYLASYVNLSEMKKWNQAPTNPKTLKQNGIKFAFTTNDLDVKNFRNNLLKAIKYGLDKNTALAALTTVPAQILKKENEIGSLKSGAWANFLITSGDYFDEETIVYENWVQGEKILIEDMNAADLSGEYDLKVAGETYKMKITGEISKPKVEVELGNKKLGSKISVENHWMNLVITSTDTTKKEFIRMVANLPQERKLISGKAILANGTETTFSASKIDSAEENEKKKQQKEKEEKQELLADVVPVTYPNMAFGYASLPKQETILFKNATVWTGESDGILENTDVLIKDGKISKIGKNLSAGNARIIDATGKHLTAGIIDEHSHIAASSINEAGQNSSAEVSIEDVINPDDISIYRNLAGGVTTVQVLHGSANPIGGKSAIIKMKWGHSPEEMIYDNSPKFIKFALGENVKQSNWSSYNRFPQTRMGVEQLFTDYFTRAKEYEQKKNSGELYRVDEEMETLVEILNGERFISCHSYVQSEINMLMKVAEKFDFRINTFTHILEGYKVADKMAEHGAGGSTFSDWWAYKYEVKDAIPYNAAIMHEQGVTVAINSDDAEMGRRLNQEAAKTVKYGGVSEEEAWKFVTLNPAKLLHLDERVGSIKIGKDADLVLWTDHPLSIYAKAEKTLIEGAVYFDLQKNEAMLKENERLRNILATQMLEAKNKGLKTKVVEKIEKVYLHCDSM
ncbi:MAG TPA: amidohydrolase family protein [Salinimicrobium sp.]|nr:amidohydrolase family protein [Salinimicrobium sp.]